MRWCLLLVLPSICRRFHCLNAAVCSSAFSAQVVGLRYCQHHTLVTSLSGGSVAIGIGYTWGHGTLYYSKDQKEYKFKLSGISVVDVGGAGITAEGEVYNLATPADLSGNYSAVTAGLTIVAGGSVAYLKNDNNGVVIKLHSQTGGLRFNLSANGMHITLQQS
jgi:hypothetical protein